MSSQLTQTWENATPERKMIYAGAAFLAIIIFLTLVAKMMPSKPTVARFDDGNEKAIELLANQISELDKRIKDLEAQTGEAVIKVANRIDENQAINNAALEKLVTEVNSHREALAAVAQYQATPREVHVIRNDKRESKVLASSKEAE